MKWQLSSLHFLFRSVLLSFSLLAFAVTSLKLSAQKRKKKKINSPWAHFLHKVKKQNQRPTASSMLRGKPLHYCQSHKSSLTYAAINSSVW